MKNWKEELQRYLPDIEQFLTSVLLEETDIEITGSEELDKKEDIFSGVREKDIFLYTRDQACNADVIVILDEEWYGLLSSIMLGVEEKSNNEITRDLLKKFAGELSGTLVKKMEENELNAAPSEVEVLTLKQVEKKLAHTAYFFAEMEVEGLADNTVRAALLIGNPAAQVSPEDKETAEPDKTDTGKPDAGEKQKVGEKKTPDGEEGEEFSPVQPEEMEKAGSYEEVISGKYIEFDEFEGQPSEHKNGDTRSMDLLKDVEMDVSVELGRIELPLGKVLQLAKGSVIELEKLAGEPVDILVNGHRIAHGEVVVIDEHFGVRVSNLVTTKQRIVGLQ